MLTNKERQVMDEILRKGSNFNCEKLDIAKSWAERANGPVEDPEHFWAFPDVKCYGCGMAKQEARGVFGSLVKKGLIDIDDLDGCEWLIIREENWKNIRKEYGMREASLAEVSATRDHAWFLSYFAGAVLWIEVAVEHGMDEKAIADKGTEEWLGRRFNEDFWPPFTVAEWKEFVGAVLENERRRAQG